MGQTLINAAIGALFAVIAKLLVGRTDFPTDVVGDGVTVDFIVVGSGSAGSVVGGRLSENPAWDVLVLEAGGTPPAESKIPALFLGLMVENNPYIYNYRTTPQKHAQFNYVNNARPYPRGKIIGGTSAINGMLYNRGNRYDYDRWAELGNSGWDYQTVLKYFKKSEDYRGSLTTENAPYHGKGGPLMVETKRWNTPVAKAILAAGLELGYPTLDTNAASQMGFSTPQTTTYNGERSSAAEAFLRPNLKRKNLKLQSDSYVTKVLLDDTLRAVGVQYTHGNQVRRAYARKEVILSAGAIDSPKLLLLSGIGPKPHLQSLGIPILVDLPGVGQNLQDHPAIYGITWNVPTGMSTSLVQVLSPWSKLQYVTKRTGLFQL